MHCCGAAKHGIWWHKKLRKLEAFHHGAARRILNIKWWQVREERIRSKQVKLRFCNKPKVETFIIHRTAKYPGKVARSSERGLPQEISWCMDEQAQKNGGVQHTYSNTFSTAISAILPEKNDLNNQCSFRYWIPEAKDETLWLVKINEYFNSCKNIDEEKYDKEEDGDET